MLMFKIYFTAFFAGFATMGYEMLLGRALVPYFGGTIYTWGALISTFLLGMSLGFVGGGRLSVRHPNSRWLLVFFVLGGTLICITPAFLEATSLFLLDRYEDVRIPAVITSTVFAFLPAAFFAATAPFCVRMALRDVNLAGAVAGRLSALNTIGSIAGTLGTSFFLVPHFGTKVIFFILGVTSIFVGILVGSRKVSATRSAVKSSPAAAVAVLLLSLLGWSPDEARAQSAGLPPLVKESVLESVESEYNTIYVMRRGNLLFMNFGYRGSHYVESVFDPARPKELVVDYTKYMTLGLIYASKTENGAFVGLGGGRTAAYLVRTVPELKLDVAELDREVIRLAQKYFAVEPSDRLKVYPQDGRLFLQRTKSKYDLVFLDAYRGPFVPFHLLTKEFFALIKSRMTPDGVVVQNVEPTTMLLDSAITTIRSVFPNVEVYDAKGNVVVVAYSGKPRSAESLRQSAARFNDKYRPLYNPLDLLQARVDFKAASTAKVLTDDFAPVEMLHTIKRHNEKRQ